MNDVAFFGCLVMFIGFAAAIPWAIRADAADAHPIHTPEANCPDCEDQP